MGDIHDKRDSETMLCGMQQSLSHCYDINNVDNSHKSLQTMYACAHYMHTSV